MFQSYTFKGKPVEDIRQWCRDNGDKLLREFWKEYDPMTGTWNYYDALMPKAWHDNMRYTKGVLIKVEEVEL